MRFGEQLTDQSGQSLVEALVASALLALAVVAGLVVLQSTGLTSGRAAQVARAQCLVRAEANAVVAAAYGSAYPAPAGVTVAVRAWPAGDHSVQLVTIAGHDPASGNGLYQMAVLKSQQVTGSSRVDPAALSEECPTT